MQHRHPLPRHHHRPAAHLVALPPDGPARIRDAVLSVDNPSTGLGWFSRSRGSTLLAQLAAGELPLTHGALDRQPPSFMRWSRL